MTARSAWERAGSWLLLVALVVAAALACSESGPHEDTKLKPASGVYVRSAWTVARRVIGHRVHVNDRSIACASCHDLAGGGVGAVTPSRCAKCHAREARIDHASAQGRARFGVGSPSDCTSCHAFTLPADAAPPVAAPLDMDGGPPLGPDSGACKRCHEQPQGHTPAVKVHAKGDCLGCHRPHDDATPKAGDCKSCHAEVSTTHTAGHTTIEVCTTCHEHLHSPASDASVACATCHATQQPLVPKTALFERGHSACVSCHEPHGASAAPTSCSSGACHGALPVMGAASVQAHAVCTSCHQPHDVRGSAVQACAGCHANVHPEHPARAGGCTSCHQPHPQGAMSLAQAGAVTVPSARACTSCHQVAGADHDLHRGVACTSCHAPHGFTIALGDKPGCRRCHEAELSHTFANSGHQACEGCHSGLPHHPEVAATTCTGCHAHEHELASAHHAPCTSCHEPHAGAVKQPCSSCHAAEARSAPAGHQACTHCHEAHSGARIASCATCHAREAATPHGKLDGGACTECHRPHGPNGVGKPPACASCHQTNALPGLHTVGEHRACARCHTEHGATVADPRAACLGCHADRREHFPSAPRCTSCHLFTSGKATAH